MKRLFDVLISGLLLVAFAALIYCGAPLLRGDSAVSVSPAEDGASAGTESGAPEAFARLKFRDDGETHEAQGDPVSTFDLGVNAVSYVDVRRALGEGRMPEARDVCVDELVNYFPPLGLEVTPRRLEESPFSVAYELAPCPWSGEEALLWMSVEVGYQTKGAMPANLVFLADVSDSMGASERLPLLKGALEMLAESLRPEDRMSIVTLGDPAEILLDGAPGDEMERIVSAVDALAVRSVEGDGGFALAYEQARKTYIEGGVNRILLCTDALFRPGPSGVGELEQIALDGRRDGVTLSSVRFGPYGDGDALIGHLAAVGNGRLGYADSLSEAKKVFGEEMSATFQAVADNIRSQIVFDPAQILSYRRLGCAGNVSEERLLSGDVPFWANDAGDGRRTVVLYALRFSEINQPSYGQLPNRIARRMERRPFGQVALRWLGPGGMPEGTVEMPLSRGAAARIFADAGPDLRFSAAVTAFGEKLRGNPALRDTSWEEIASWAETATAGDAYREEFLHTIGLARSVERESGDRRD